MQVLLRGLVVLAFAVAAAVTMTWPVGRHLCDHLAVPRVFIGRGLLPTAPDTYLHLWILAWVHHALITAPSHLFDANIMYPATRALAGSEHMLGHWPVHAPVYAASGNPVLAYQWVLLSSFVLNAVALWALLARWTENAAAAALGAFIYAFVPLRFDLIGTVQHMNAAYLPLAVLFADRWRAQGRLRDLAGIALATVLQTLCSYYLAYATVMALGVLGIAVATGGRWRRALGVAAAAAVGLVPLALVSGPYLALRRAGVVPEYPEVWLRAASATPAWFVRRDLPLFAGWLPLALAGVGAVAGRADPWRRWFALGILAVGFVLVLGPVATLGSAEVSLPYRALYAGFPGFSSLRYPYRFGTLTALGLALLGGLGWARLAGRRALAWPLTAVALVVVGLEYRQAPLQLVPVEVGSAVPPAYRWLGAHGNGRPVLEWPIPPPGDLRAGYTESRAMYFSTYHWLPLLNGYTAYEPPSHAVVSLLALRLPDAGAVRDLVELAGARLLLLHRDRLDPAAQGRWEAWLRAGCERLGEFGPDVICGLPPGHVDLRAALVGANERRPEQTFRGLPLAPLPPEGRSGTIGSGPTGAMGAGLVHRLRVEVTNRSQVVWPGLAPLVAGVVTIRHRWRREVDGVVAAPWTATPLLCDLAPGDSCAVVLPVIAPAAPGDYRLELGLAQEDGPEIVLERGALLDLPVRVVSLGRARTGR
jgi:hypothetical protein